MMFERPGIGLDDLAWIQRDQFVYYVEMAHGLGDPKDWARLRQDLVEALTAALGLDPPETDSDASTAADLRTSRQRRALDLLEKTRARHDPAVDWPAFFDALWEGRRNLRADL